jgi:hypothetical protein
MKFKDLKTGQTFDFIGPDFTLNSFTLRCEKISPRQYRDEKGAVHQVGTISCKVYHVREALPNPWAS